APLMLDMARWGVSDVYQLAWLTPPPGGAVAQALDTLHQLDALENGKITKHGKNIHELPCHPRIAHMLLLADDDKKSLAADIAALLEERDPLYGQAGIDINDRIEALRRFRQGGGQGGKFSRIEKIAASYRKLIGATPDNDITDPYE